MDKKTLLAEATRKLERQPVAPRPLQEDAELSAPPLLRTTDETSEANRKERTAARDRRVVSKGITLRPSNLEKLDKLELSLRKQGIKAGHSGLIQIAIDLLEDNAELADAYRALLKLDLRLK